MLELLPIILNRLILIYYTLNKIIILVVRLDTKMIAPFLELFAPNVRMDFILIYRLAFV